MTLKTLNMDKKKLIDENMQLKKKYKHVNIVTNNNYYYLEQVTHQDHH